jgi:hypothetical protein
MSGPKRNPDKINTLGIVVVGICSAVLVYVAIVALQAYYANDTAEIQTMRDYGGQDTTAKTHRAAEMQNITEKGGKSGANYRISIDEAIKDVARDAKIDPAHLVPALPKSDKPTIEPVFGRPVTKSSAPAAPAPAGAGSAAGSGSGAGSGTPAAIAPATPTGTPGAPQPVAGAGGAPATGSGSAH